MFFLVKKRRELILTVKNTKKNGKIGHVELVLMFYLPLVASQPHHLSKSPENQSSLFSLSHPFFFFFFFCRVLCAFRQFLLGERLISTISSVAVFFQFVHFVRLTGFKGNFFHATTFFCLVQESVNVFAFHCSSRVYSFLS